MLRLFQDDVADGSVELVRFVRSSQLWRVLDVLERLEQLVAEKISIVSVRPPPRIDAINVEFCGLGEFTSRSGQ
jgi:hypothetical protein